MARPTVAEIAAEAAVLMNDAGGATYSVTVLLPLIKKAFRELALKAFNATIPEYKEISAILTLNALATQITDATTTGVFPTDMAAPIKLEERAGGAAAGTPFTPMTETDWDPDVIVDVELKYWNWRDSIHTPGSSQTRDVKIYYIEGQQTIVDGASIILLDNSLTVLAARTASLGARYLQKADDRADTLSIDHQIALNDLINSWAHQKQGVPMRRRPFGIGRRR